MSIFWFCINGYTKIRMSSEDLLSYFLAAAWMNFFKVQRKIRHRTVLFIIHSSQLKPEVMPKITDQNSLLPLPGEKSENFGDFCSGRQSTLKKIKWSLDVVQTKDI